MDILMNGEPTHVEPRLQRTFERRRGCPIQRKVVEFVGHHNWNLAPQATLRVTGRVRCLQDSLHCIGVGPGPHVEPDLEPCALSVGSALEHRARSSEVRHDPRPSVLERNFQVSRAPRELGEQSERHARDEVHERGRRAAFSSQVRALIAH